MNRYNEESIGNLSNTFVVKESSERKPKFEEIVKNEMLNSKENVNMKNSADEEDFQFG